MIKQLLIPFLILIYGCSIANEGETPTEDKTIDLFGLTYSNRSNNKLISAIETCKNESNFTPLYIGQLSDTIHIDDSYSPQDQADYQTDKYADPLINDIKIIVDTTQFLSTNSIKYKSYPVLIQNLKDTALTIGYGSHLPMVLQAKDSLGNWQSVQHHYIYFCGTGMLYPYLKENQILVASCALYDGDFTTKLRLAYGWENLIYSNEFNGDIAYGMFTACKTDYY